MKAYELSAKINHDGKLVLPDQLPLFLPQQVIKVILLVPEMTENQEQEWINLTTEQFFNGYSDEDSIYDAI